MNRIPFIFVALAFSFWGCSEQPSPTLNRKMAAVVRDINIAEAALQGTNDNVRDSLYKLYYDQVFTIHHVTEDEFYRFMDSLRNNPQMAKMTYEYLKEELEKEAKNDKVK